MSTKGKITELFDISSIEAQKKEVLGYVDEFIEKTAKVKPIKVKLEGSEKTREVVKGISELNLTLKEYEKLNNAGAQALAKLNALESESAKETKKAQIALQERNKAIADEIKLEQAAEGSIAKKQLQLKQLQKTYDNLSEAQRNTGEGKALLQSVQDLDSELKQLEGSTGRFQRNVGNYANAFGEAFGVAKKSLDDIQRQLKSGSNLGADQVQKLAAQEQLLAQITEQLSQEFSTSKQQSRAYQEAVTQLGLAFGQQSEVFQEFRNQVGEGVDALNDIKDSIKLAASDTKQLDRIIGAAQGIAGAFSIAQGAAALFGDENEELQKTFVKLQAAMTILNGLQAIQNELKNKDSIFSKAINYLTAARTKQTQQQTIAQQASNTATNAGTTAVNRFSVALKGIGIGLLLTLLPLAAKAFEGVGSAAKKVDEIFGEADSKTTALNDALKEMGETALEIGEASISELKDYMKKLNDELGNTPTQVEKAKASIELLDKRLKELDSFNTLGKKSIGESLNDIVSLFALGFIKTTEENIVEAKKQLNDLIENIQNAEIELKGQKIDDEFKKELIDRRNAVRENAKIQADLIIDANGRILSNENSTYKQRLVALTNLFSQQKKVIELTRDIQLEGEKDEIKRQLIIAKSTAEIVKASRDFSEKLSKLKEDEQKRLDELRQKELDKLNAYLNDRKKLELDASKNIKENINARNKEQLELILSNQEKETEAIIQAKDKQLERLNQLFQSGAITEKKYQDERAEIEFNASKAVLESQIKFTEQYIRLAKLRGIDTTNAEKELAKARIGLSDLVTNHIIENSKKESEAEEKRRKRFEKMSNDAETIKGLTDSLVSGASDVFSALTDRQSDEISKQLELIDKKKENEIKAINATTASEAEKQKKIQELTIRTDAQKAQLDAKDRQRKIANARFEKIANVSSIISTTALAVIKALAEGDPFTRIPRSIAAGIIGAAQLAAALAAPLPRFKDGTEDAPGGFAVVGDGGKKELVVEPSGKSYLTSDKPTVSWIPKHSKIYPDADALANISMSNSEQKIRSAFSVGSSTSNYAIEQKLDAVVTAIKGKETAMVINKWSGFEIGYKSSNRWHKYINENTQF